MYKLSKEEWEVLNQVKCTKEQAEIILKRNSVVLEKINLLISAKSKREFDQNFYAFNCQEYFHIGCPHCNAIYQCSGCAYDIPILRENRLKNDSSPKFFCVMCYFNGITYKHISYYLGLSYRGIWISSHELLIKCRQSNKIRDFKRQILIPIKKFLLGHIEWANSVLNKELDGCKTIDGRIYGANY